MAGTDDSPPDSSSKTPRQSGKTLLRGAAFAALKVMLREHPLTVLRAAGAGAGYAARGVAQNAASALHDQLGDIEQRVRRARPTRVARKAAASNRPRRRDTLAKLTAEHEAELAKLQQFASRIE